MRFDQHLESLSADEVLFATRKDFVPYPSFGN